MGESYLIVGLGNPGERYRKTRHNLGYMVAEALAKRREWEFKRGWRVKGKVAEGREGKKTIRLLLPTTYMNLSGEAVKKGLDYYKIPLRNLLVVVDDVYLPFGVLRLKGEGSSGGHKGLQNIEEKLSTQNFARLRIGIGEIEREKSLEQFVLEEFDLEQQQHLPQAIDHGVDVVECWLEQGMESAMQLAGNLTKEWQK